MSYWTKSYTRRGVIVTGAMSAAGAAMLACSGSKNSGSSSSGAGESSSAASSGGQTQDKSSLLTAVQDTRSQAKPGGIWSSWRTTDFITLDPINTRGSNVGHTQLAYSVIAAYKPNSRVGSVTMEGEAAQSWEISPDGMKITFKLRPNVKLDPRPPTNGRALTAQDWLYTWDVFTAKSPQAGELIKKLDPNAPIDSWSAPDSNTVVFNLAYPWPVFLPLLNNTRYGLVIVPVEHDGKYDPNIETRGSGPFFVQRWDPSNTIEWRRNPNYWDAPRPYLDGINQPILAEYAARLSQYKAGNIWDADVTADDILSLKRENPKIVVWKNTNYTAASMPLALNLRPNSPFQDIRVRKGLSMLYDRDLLMRTYRNIDGFAKEGIDIKYKIHTIVSAADSTYWIDPTGTGLGASAANFKYNPTEAAKLLDAAGIKNLKLPFSVQKTATPEQQALVGMLNATGHFNFSVDGVDPATYVRTIFQPHGNIDGVAPLSNGASLDPDLALTRYYATSNYTMFPSALPYDDLLRKQQREFDVNKRKDLWKQIQVAWADNLLDLTGVPAGVADTLETWQPWLANRGAFVGPLGNTTYDISLTKQYWYDESKKT